MSAPQKYRKKPVEITAVRFDGHNLDELETFTLGFRFKAESTDMNGGPQVAEVWNHLHNTWVGVKVGDWIIQGVQGEFYPRDDQVFAATYEAVSE